MRDLVELLVRGLVDDQDAVEITETETGGGQLIEIRVAPDDVGKVIGKQGRIIKALRTVVRAAAARDSRRVRVEVPS